MTTKKHSPKLLERAASAAKRRLYKTKNACTNIGRIFTGDLQKIRNNTIAWIVVMVFAETLENSTKGTVILAGIEAHICVEQTALDLIREGYRVALVTDCIDSRNPQNKERTILRLAQEGVVITTYESVLYELLGSAKAPEFKAISAIVK